MYPLDLLRELAEDNKSFTASQRKAHELCDDNGDVASASLLEVLSINSLAMPAVRQEEYPTMRPG